jgi:hypothetical protein
MVTLFLKGTVGVDSKPAHYNESRLSSLLPGLDKTAPDCEGFPPRYEYADRQEE